MWTIGILWISHKTQLVILMGYTGYPLIIHFQLIYNQYVSFKNAVVWMNTCFLVVHKAAVDKLSLLGG
jgi:hypothetical protein